MSPVRLERAGIVIEGTSVAGFETCLHLPGFRAALDLGALHASVVPCPTIFFTHPHLDHMGAVANHCALRSLQHMTPPTYVVPAETAPAVERMFEAWRALDGSDLPCIIVPLAPGEQFELSREVVVRAFATSHRGPSQGYAFVSRRSKLKLKYRGMSEGDLRRLRVEEGVEITTTLETIELAYPGDCRVDVVDEEELVRTARVLCLEATFLDDRVPVPQARREGHVHLDEIAARADLFENEEIVLMHFSARYRSDEIRAALAEKLPADLAVRVTPLLQEDSP